MTPEERELVVDLFRRLAALEREPRDLDAERLMREGLQRAPNAVYALVQTVLLQDEALKAADDRIAQLEDDLQQAQAGGQQRSGSFLGQRREGRWNTGEVLRGSVPPVRPGDQPMGAPPGYGGDRGYEQPMAGGPMGGGYGGPMGAEPSRGGSFLGTAAAAAAGAIGGGLLMSGIRSAMGGGQGGGGPFSGAFDQLSGGKSGGGKSGGGGGMPWDKAGSNEMSREAGLDDIGAGGPRYGAADVSSASYAKGTEGDTDEGDFDDDFAGGFEDDPDST